MRCNISHLHIALARRRWICGSIVTNVPTRMNEVDRSLEGRDNKALLTAMEATFAAERDRWINIRQKRADESAGD